MEQLLFVGTYSEDIQFGTGEVYPGRGEGIHALWFDPATGAIHAGAVTRGVSNPSFVTVAPSKRFLYAVNELKEFRCQFGGGLSAFTVDATTGALSPLNAKPTRGTDPCHVIVHPNGKFALVANYSSGSVIVFPLNEDGSLGEATDFVEHHGSSVNAARQEGPHAHQVVFDATGQWALVPELGVDRLMIYRFDSELGKLAPASTPYATLPAGAGPRHLVMHPSAPFFYLVCELNSTITAFTFDVSTGAVAPLQTLSLLPADFNGQSSGADVQVTPNGRFLCASNRGANLIAVFALDAATGRMTVVTHVPSGGKIPRNFAIDPSGEWMIVTNQDSNNVLSYRIDAKTGIPSPTGVDVPVGTPVCVRFFDGA